MADQTQFKHIKVNAGEDDDVVIYAGLHSAEKNAETSTEIPTIASSHEHEHEPSPAPSPVTETSAEQYQETTLDDIRTSKMPAMQKVILAIAAIAIIAFIVWYVCFR